MLVHNRYLQELGINKDTYPLGNSCNHDAELDKDEGVIPCQTWNLNLTLAMELYTYLRTFKDEKPGYPACLKSAEQWDKILDEMIEGFADYIRQKDEFQPKMAKFNRSMNLLKEWWGALWW